MRYWSPLHPTMPIEEGRKLIVFNPPGELLSGERIHQWMGARVSLNKGGSNFVRIERHKILLLSLQEQNFDFKRIIRNGDYYSTYGDNVFKDLKQVRPGWRFETLGPLKHAKKGKIQVLVKMSPFHPRSIIRRLFGLSRDY